MKFQAHVKRVTPRLAINFDEPMPKCYCGVSLAQANANFEGQRLKALIAWLACHSKQCRIVIGDDLHRWNIMIWDGCSAARSRKLAQRKGKLFVGQLRPLLTRYPLEKFQVVYWREMTEQPEFAAWLREVNKMILDDASLADCLQLSARSFVMRQIQRGRRLRTSFEEAMALSMQYIIEEIAVFGRLSEDGWCVDVYPGQELPLLAEIAKNQCPTIPKPLRDRINVELGIRLAQHFDGVLAG